MSFVRSQRLFESLLIVWLLALAAWPSALYAEDLDSPVLVSAQITETDGDVVIDWALPDTVDTVSAASVAESLSTLRYGGYDLPVELLRFRVMDNTRPPELVLEVVESVKWDGGLTPARELTPPVVDWVPPELPIEASAASALPSLPVFVHSKGRLRGIEFQVVAISPIFEEDGVTKFARRVRARMDGVRPVKGDLTDTLLADEVRAASSSAPWFADAADLAPTNPAAAVNSVKLVVTQQGIQRLSGQNLASTALDLSNVDTLGLTYRGQAIPLDVGDTNNNGKLDGNETLSFYAPAVGDYWNEHEVYWLFDQDAAPARMTTRSVAPDEAQPAPSRSTALELGIWRGNKTYDPGWPGRDKDHWFAQRMTVAPGMQGKPPYPTLTAEPQFKLSRVSGVSTITPHLTLVQQVAEYELRMTAGEGKTAKLKPHEAVKLNGLWSPEFNVTSSFSSIELVLVPTDSRGTVLVDSIEWEAPVALNFANKGALFSGVTGIWRYALAGLPVGAGLYDITDPLQPVRLTGMSGGLFEDGPDARAYLLSGPGVIHTPQIEAHTPVVFSASGGADALYIAPSEFIDALAPLVSHRQKQGYQVRVIDVNEIYDAWGYGHVDPVAIRKFLQFAVQEMNPSPISAVLVSDATRDPFNYEQKASNVNFIPPYLVSSYRDQLNNEKRFDPFWGQNGCETCYGQLDGDDPLNNDVELPPGVGFMMDIWIGRFPAKNVADVEGIVDKILRYEAPSDASKVWKSQALFLADNYYFVDGSTDSAGDFLESSEKAISLLPDGIWPRRLYYDPTAPGEHPWLVSNSVSMHTQAIDLLGQGPGLVTYNGHSAHWQWARTSECATPPPPGEACPENETNPAPYILGLYDIDILSNRAQPYVGLSMTCFTSQFFEPADSGTVLDERAFVYPTGGAVAIWGPSGLSVAKGHDDLQYGFHRKLWDLTEKSPGSARLGQLVEAGYMENWAPSCDERAANAEDCYTCCDDVRRTFLLMGDPLTPIQMRPTHELYLPLIPK